MFQITKKFEDKKASFDPNLAKQNFHYSDTIVNTMNSLLTNFHFPIPLSISFEQTQTYQEDKWQNLEVKTFQKTSIFNNQFEEHVTHFYPYQRKVGHIGNYIVGQSPIYSFRPIAEKFEVEQKHQQTIQSNIQEISKSLSNGILGIFNLAGLFSYSPLAVVSILTKLKDVLEDQRFYTDIKSVQHLINKTKDQIKKINSSLPDSERLSTQELEGWFKNFDLLFVSSDVVFFVSPEAVPLSKQDAYVYAEKAMEKNKKLGENLCKNFIFSIDSNNNQKTYYNVWGIDKSPEGSWVLSQEDVSNAVEMLKTIHLSLNLFLSNLQNFLNYMSTTKDPPYILKFLYNSYQNLLKSCPAIGIDPIDGIKQIDNEINVILSDLNSADPNKRLQGFENFQLLLKKVSVSKLNSTSLHKELNLTKSNIPFYSFLNDFFSIVGRNILFIPSETSKKIMELSVNYIGTDLKLNQGGNTPLDITGFFASTFNVTVTSSLKDFTFNSKYISSYIKSAFEEVNPGYKIEVQEQKSGVFLVKVTGNIQTSMATPNPLKQIVEVSCPATFSPEVKKKEKLPVYQLNYENIHRIFTGENPPTQKVPYPLSVDLFSNSSVITTSDNIILSGKTFFVPPYEYRKIMAEVCKELLERVGINIAFNDIFLSTFATNGNFERQYVEAYSKFCKDNDKTPTPEGYQDFVAEFLFEYIKRTVTAYYFLKHLDKNQYDSLLAELDKLFPPTEIMEEKTLPNGEKIKAIKIVRSFDENVQNDLLRLQYRYQFSIAYFSYILDPSNPLNLTEEQKAQYIKDFEKEAETYYQGLKKFISNKSSAILSYEFYHTLDELASYGISNANLGVKFSLGHKKQFEFLLGFSFLGPLLSFIQGKKLEYGDLPDVIPYGGNFLNEAIGVGVTKPAIGFEARWNEEFSTPLPIDFTIVNNLSLSATYFLNSQTKFNKNDAIIQKCYEIWDTYKNFVSLLITYPKKEELFITASVEQQQQKIILNNLRYDLLRKLAELEELLPPEAERLKKLVNDAKKTMSDDGFLELANYSKTDKDKKGIFEDLTVDDILFCIPSLDFRMSNLFENTADQDGIFFSFFSGKQFSPAGISLGNYHSPTDYGLMFLQEQYLFFASLKNKTVLTSDIVLKEGNNYSLNFSPSIESNIYLNALLVKTLFTVLQKSSDDQTEIDKIKEQKAFNFLSSFIKTSLVFNLALKSLLSYSSHINVFGQPVTFNPYLNILSQFFGVINESDAFFGKRKLFGELGNKIILNNFILGQSVFIEYPFAYGGSLSLQYEQENIKVDVNAILRRDQINQNQNLTYPRIYVKIEIPLFKPKKNELESSLETESEPSRAYSTYENNQKQKEEKEQLNQLKRELKNFQKEENVWEIHGRTFNDIHKAYSFYLEVKGLDEFLAFIKNTPTHPLHSIIFKELNFEERPNAPTIFKSYSKTNEAIRTLYTAEEVLDFVYDYLADEAERIPSFSSLSPGEKLAEIYKTKKYLELFFNQLKENDVATITNKNLKTPSKN
ncbi:MAG: hypothetical protein N3D10_00315 [Candidatus Micrarchaeota archaeon]|nr:hypothetical protein [Candidatus Micrarchaeota archaeon]